MNLIKFIRSLSEVSERPPISAGSSVDPVIPIPALDLGESVASEMAAKDAEIDRLKKRLCDIHHFAGECQKNMMRDREQLALVWCENEEIKSHIRKELWLLKDYFKSA